MGEIEYICNNAEVCTHKTCIHKKSHKSHRTCRFEECWHQCIETGRKCIPY